MWPAWVLSWGNLKGNASFLSSWHDLGYSYGAGCQWGHDLTRVTNTPRALWCLLHFFPSQTPNLSSLLSFSAPCQEGGGIRDGKSLSAENAQVARISCYSTMCSWRGELPSWREVSDLHWYQTLVFSADRLWWLRFPVQLSGRVLWDLGRLLDWGLLWWLD